MQFNGVDVRSWFMQQFPRARSNAKGDRLRHACPFHDDSPSGGGSFVVFLPDGNWVCKADSCAKKGSFPLLFKTVENLSWAEVYARLKITQPLHVEEMGKTLFGEVPQELAESVSPLPVYGLVPVSEAWPGYLTERGYPPGSIDPYGLYVGTANQFRGHLIFPFWDMDGNYKSFTARRMSFRKEEGRYVGPANNTNDHYLYGAHVLRQMDVRRIIVVEGQFDVMRLWTYGEAAVGLSNKDATAWQVVEIREMQRRHNCPVVVMLDGSASQWTTKLSFKLANAPMPVSAAYLPDGIDPDRSSLELIQHTLEAAS